MENTQYIQAWLNNKTLLKAQINTKFSTATKLKKAVKEIRIYSFNQLQNSWLAYSNITCPRCKASIRKEQSGGRKHFNYFCHNCQLLFRK